MKGKLIINKKLIFTSLSIVLLPIFVLSIAVNSGFRYFEGNEHFKVRIIEEDEELVENAITDLTEIDEISRIDRNNSAVYIEKTTLEEVRSGVLDTIGNSVNYEIITVNEIDKVELFQNIISVFIILAISLSIIIFYLVSRNNFIFDKVAVRSIVLTSLSSLIISIIFQIGFLSLFSLIYQVRILDVYIPLVSAIFSLALVIISLSFISTLDKDNDEDVKEKFLKEINKYSKILTILIPSTIIPLWLSLGENFVIPSLIFILGIIYFVFSIRNLLYFNPRLKVKVKKSNKSIKQKTKEVSSVEPIKTTESKKKKSKKNKKKKGR